MLEKKGMKVKIKFEGRGGVMVACKKRGRGLKSETRQLKTAKSIELKWLLDTNFTTKNCFSALDLGLGYSLFHLYKTKTYLITTLISLIRDKQVENLR